MSACDTEPMSGPRDQIFGNPSSELGGKPQEENLQPIFDLWMCDQVVKRLEQPSARREEGDVVVNQRKGRIVDHHTADVRKLHRLD